MKRSCLDGKVESGMNEASVGSESARSPNTGTSPAGESRMNSALMKSVDPSTVPTVLVQCKCKCGQ